jgi:chromosome segregation ATPase
MVVLDDLLESVNLLNTRIDDFNPERMTSQFDDLISKVNEYQNSWIEKINVIDMANTNYENTLISLNALNQKTTDMSTMIDDINEYQQDIVLAIDRMQQEIYEICNSVESFKEKVEKDINNFKLEIRDSIDILEKELDNAIRELRNELNSRLEKFVNETNKRIDRLDDLIKSLYEFYNNEIENIKNLIYQIDSKVNNNTIKINDIYILIESLNASIDDLIKKYNDLYSRLAQLEDRLNREIGDIYNEIEKLKNGGLKHVVLTESEFNNLSEEEQNAEDTLYLIKGGENTTIDLSSYQKEIEELKQLVKTLTLRIEILENSGQGPGPELNNIARTDSAIVGKSKIL